MNAHPRLDEIGRLVGDPSRATMLAALMDGRAWTGRELARFAHVTPSTASSHLARLVDGSLVAVVAQGRHNYYRIASPVVAHVLESLMVLAPERQAKHASQRRIAEDLAAARLCYDHLAGKLGVAVTDALVTKGYLVVSDVTATMTPEGTAFCRRIGVEVERGRATRPLCRPCLDWSERRPHVAGVVGAALARCALERQWIRRETGSRALTVTAQGRATLRDLLDIDSTALGDPR